jgi:NTE family protein
MKVSLCLSGGGARGVAHLGILQKIQETHPIEIVAISGASAGAIVGAFVAAGYAPKAILEILQNTEFWKHFRPSFSGGFINLKNFRALFDKYLPQNIEDLKLPFYACVTNLDSGKAEYLNSGNIFDSIIASSTIPLLFSPNDINGKFYVDGGLVNNLPIEPLIPYQQKILALNINPLESYAFDKSVRSIATRIIHIVTAASVHDKIEKCDFYIVPKGIETVGILDFKAINKAYEIGYATTLPF